MNTRVNVPGAHTHAGAHPLGALWEPRVITLEEVAELLCVAAATECGSTRAWFSSPLPQGSWAGDVLPGTPGPQLPQLSPHHTHPLQASMHRSVWTSRLKGGVSVPRESSALPVGTLSVLPARGPVLMLQQARQLSCHCASKEVDAWVNTQEPCQWEGRACQSSPSSVVGFSAQPP